MRGVIFLLIFILSSVLTCVHALVIERSGNPEDLRTEPNFLICLEGGGSKDDFAPAWIKLLEAAKGGDVVTIKAHTDTDHLNDWIYYDEGQHAFPKVNSATRILIEDASDANVPQIERLLDNAEFIFFQGGDQAFYNDWLLNSRIAAAVNRALHVRKIPVAGTSAGMAILGGIDYLAHFDSPSEPNENVSGLDVLMDPTADYVDLGYSLFTPPFMNFIVTDTHFSERNRFGRPMGFMAKAYHHFKGKIALENIRSIAADEGTAFCYNEKGIGKAYGLSSVFMLRANKNIEVFEAGKALVWDAEHQAVKAYVLDATKSDNEFDLNSWEGRGGRAEYWWVEETLGQSTPAVKRAAIQN